MEKETLSDCKVATESNDSKLLVDLQSSSILKNNGNIDDDDEKETSSDCKVAAESNDLKSLIEYNSKKQIDEDENETSSDCKVAVESNDSESTGPKDHNKDTINVEDSLSFMPSHHEHQDFDLKFEHVSSLNDDNAERRVTSYSRGQRKMFHVGSSCILLQEQVTSRIKMSYDGPVSFLQCTSLPFNRTKLNGAFLVF